MQTKTGRFIWVLFRFNSEGYMVEVQRWNRDVKPDYRPAHCERLQRQYIEE